ncbi:hypothetical protein [Synechococcus sp. CBW1006]|uniref:hypothetical protein n=1 Tax=Synechococcus sp. CBW1006 TaxID=1353138 RepID=UPI0018CDFCA3|nr:hypothetical protein [Synechococcus sp. CBW1006]QPN65836.1 hypothetical protein H8F26_13160 [Synechococcus sp. CBW1006]
MYLDLAASAANNPVMSASGFECCHSLTTADSTWLLGKHLEFGEIAILQRNFSLEAVFFDDLSLLVLIDGRLQVQMFTNMIHIVFRNFADIENYLMSVPTFGGLNFTFPNPLHTICFGHSALLAIQNNGIALGTTAWCKESSLWFNPSNAFPSVVRNINLVSTMKSPFLELTTGNPIFLLKAAHKYNPFDDDLNRKLDLELLGSSCRSKVVPSAGNFKIWLGLTSGKRSLVNELDVMLVLAGLLIDKFSLSEIVVDGWTSSSDSDSKAREVNEPSVYKSHSSEYEAIMKAIRKAYPDCLVRSLIGISYEEKVLEALGCSFSFTSGFTASIVPSRICALPGIVHCSNRGKGLLKTHIHRKSLMVPSHIIEDQPHDSSVHPADTSYKIKLDDFVQWTMDHVFPCIALATVSSNRQSN